MTISTLIRLAVEVSNVTSLEAVYACPKEQLILVVG